jgi:outer membrane murein-binding lipoprotein Lpp
LQEKLQEQERAVHMLQSDLCAMREERDALISQWRMHASKQDEDDSEGATQKAAIQTSVAQTASDEKLDKLNTRVQELESILSQKSDEVDAMREDLALRSHSVDRSKNRIRELESMLANAQTQSKEDSALMGAEYDNLKQENVSLRSMLESLRAKLEEQRSEETRVDAHAAETMLAALRKRYAEQEQVLAQTRETLERTDNELAVVHKQLKVFSKEREKTERRGETADEAEYIEEIDEIEEIEEVEPEKEF